jgi:exodeoxyribonuclease VII large subunit
MSNGRYLKTDYRDRERVKALGAKWDAEVRKWYVPPGRDLAPFATWLPAAEPDGDATSRGVEPVKGIALSALLAGVADAVARAYGAGVWTRVEVSRADVRRGHLYLELSERTPEGDAIAQARGVIWESTANSILPEFERATGVVIGAGIKLLVRAKPTMHPLYGMSLVIDAIDPEYTLGDLEARKREIRTRLQREGLFDRNRQLPTPWDYQHVLVVAPPSAAGLGDFQAEAGRLQQHAVCRFDYVHSRFQGDGAAAEIRTALLAAFDALEGNLPDAVAIIRGGGAVNDLAWLNDYELARCVSELPAPVLTGIGHERDSTILDEVAQQSFDTPSKVILAIEQLIARRAAQAKANFDLIAKSVQRDALQSAQRVAQTATLVRTRAIQSLAQAARQCDAGISEVKHLSQRQLQTSHRAVHADLESVRAMAGGQLANGRETAARLSVEVQSEARRVVQLARERSGSLHRAVAERTAALTKAAADMSGRDMGDIGALARRQLRDGAHKAEGLMREIAGQGPQKSLRRGFAIVRTPDGTPITRVAQAPPGTAIEIEMSDGRVAATTQNTKKDPSHE